MSIIGMGGAGKEGIGTSSSKSGQGGLGGGSSTDSHPGNGGSLLKLMMDTSGGQGGGDGDGSKEGGSEGKATLGRGGLKLSMDEDGLREMRDNMAAAAKIVKQHHAGTVDGVVPTVGAEHAVVFSCF